MGTVIEDFSLALPMQPTARSQTDLAVLVAQYSSLLFRVAHSVLRSRAEAFGFSVPGPDAFEAGAKYLLARGYR